MRIARMGLVLDWALRRMTPVANGEGNTTWQCGRRAVGAGVWGWWPRGEFYWRVFCCYGKDWPRQYLKYFLALAPSYMWRWRFISP